MGFIVQNVPQNKYGNKIYFVKFIHAEIIVSGNNYDFELDFMHKYQGMLGKFVTFECNHKPNLHALINQFQITDLLKRINSPNSVICGTIVECVDMFKMLPLG